MAKKQTTRPGRRRYSREQKNDLVAMWRQSGMSMALFCREKQLAYFTFTRWVYNRLGDESVPQVTAKFLPVKVAPVDNRARFASVEVHGTVIHIFHPVDAAYLRTLLGA
jgi:hypothetical protein